MFVAITAYLGSEPRFVVGSGTIISTGFEAPYVAGPLQGQPSSPPVWLTAGSGVSTAIVESSVGVGGGAGVTVQRAASVDGNQRWAIPVTGYPTQRYVILDWDMRVAHQTVPNGFGPFFGAETYDATVSQYLLGSLGVDATTGDVLYQLQDSGYLNTTGTVVNFNQWYHYRVVLDFSSDSYKGYVNGNLVASTGFVDRGANLNHFTDADISTFAAQGDAISLALAGTAVFDNFVVRDGLLGDYNLDGIVDNADFSTWRATYGNTVATAGNLADGNSNGKVDAADYIIWRANRGASVAGGAGIGSSVVPEPACGLPLMIAALALLQRNRRFRSPRVIHAIHEEWDLPGVHWATLTERMNYCHSVPGCFSLTWRSQLSKHVLTTTESEAASPGEEQSNAWHFGMPIAMSGPRTPIQMHRWLAWGD